MAYEKVVITGMGTCNSIGSNSLEFADSLKAGKSNFRTDGTDIHMIGGYIDNFVLNEQLNQYQENDSDLISRMKKILRRESKELQVTCCTVLEAYRMAQIAKDDVDKERISVVVAGSNLNSCLELDYIKQFGTDYEYTSASYAIQFMDTNYVGVISEIFQAHGEGFSVGGASASGNMALIQGMRLIQSGVSDIVIVAAPVTALTPFMKQAFINAGAMGGKVYKNQPEEASRPFDQKHEGFIYGEGAGCIILESFNSAKKRNTTILSELAGAAVVMDGNHLSNPSVEGEKRVMRMAMERAGVSASEVDYINAHGSSSKLGDEVECEAIMQVFQDNIHNVMVNSTKCLTGHCLYAAGLIETIASVIQMQSGFVHPSKNIEVPITQEIQFAPTIAVEKQCNITVNNSFGFGGINTSIILKKEV